MRPWLGSLFYLTNHYKIFLPAFWSIALVAAVFALLLSVELANSFAMSSMELIISGRERDLGGFSVRRILPHSAHRMVGPFIFFDHMGPAEFAVGEGMNVRPHPHIHLATVTYLFEGKIHHLDSLGSDQWIEPGAINWMTAGIGIVHSERTLGETRRLNGIQCWVALPAEHENTTPSFTHHPAMSLPEFSWEGARLKLLLGKAFGKESPVPVHSELFYLDAVLPKGRNFSLELEAQEGAVYVAQGKIKIEDKDVGPYSMVVGKEGSVLKIEAQEDSRLILLGGKPVGKRYIFWNFVSSSEENLEAAKRDWAKGPGPKGSRFPKVPGDEAEFIPLPE